MFYENVVSILTIIQNENRILSTITQGVESQPLNVIIITHKLNHVPAFWVLIASPLRYRKDTNKSKENDQRYGIAFKQDEPKPDHTKCNYSAKSSKQSKSSFVKLHI